MSHLEPLLLLFVRSALSKSLVYGISRRNASFNKEKLGNNINTSVQEEGKKISAKFKDTIINIIMSDRVMRALFSTRAAPSRGRVSC